MPNKGVDSVERALSLLIAFKDGEPTLSLGELAERTGLYKSTILRISVSLGRFGFLVRGTDGRYRLGDELWRLGNLCRRTFELEGLVRPVLRRLVDVTEETASFYVRDGRQRVCLYRLNSPRPIRHHLEEGARLPLDRGAAGRVLLAFDGAVGVPYGRIRKSGHYTSRGERDPDSAAVAVPVFDAGGTLRGALAVSTLLTRLDERAEETALVVLHTEAEQLANRIPAEQ